MFDGFNNIIIYQDDTLIGAPTEQQLDLKVQQAIKRITDKGMTINSDKSTFKSRQLTFLGYRISSFLYKVLH